LYEVFCRKYFDTTDTMSEKEELNPDLEKVEEPATEEAPAEAEAPAAEGDVGISELLEKLEEATAEVNTQKERYLRTVADLENYRKRALRDKEDARRQANCGLVEDLLPVLDNFKLGLKSAADHEGGDVFAEGFRMILTQMEAALKQNGLEEINPEKALFDPNFHESVSHMPHDTIADGHVVEVHRIGYKLHERLIRPAVVVVSSGPAKDPETSEEA
jgi:molecular chaperone GrpE